MCHINDYANNDANCGTVNYMIKNWWCNSIRLHFISVYSSYSNLFFLYKNCNFFSIVSSLSGLMFQKSAKHACSSPLWELKSTCTSVCTHIVLHTLCGHSFVLVYLKKVKIFKPLPFNPLKIVFGANFVLVFPLNILLLNNIPKPSFLRKLRISNLWKHCVDVCKSTQCFKFLHSVDTCCSQVHTLYATQNHIHQNLNVVSVVQIDYELPIPTGDRRATTARVPDLTSPSPMDSVSVYTVTEFNNQKVGRRTIFLFFLFKNKLNKWRTFKAHRLMSI